jgi:hypothetical protein
MAIEVGSAKDQFDNAGSSTTQGNMTAFSFSSAVVIHDGKKLFSISSD